MLGTGFALGILGLAWILAQPQSPDGSGRRRPHLVLDAQRRGTRPPVSRRSSLKRLSVPAGVGAFCLIVTRWPVAGVLGGFAFATLPGSLRKVVPGASSKRAEAIAGWTESIRDSLAASAGLAQAIVVTASSAPIPIRPQVGALATRLANGVPLDAALRTFSLEVDDPAAEFLVCALLLAATARAQRLVDVLGALADSIRDDVSMHLRVDASRASARSSVRTVVIFSIVFACTLTVVAHSYLRPFGTAAGQVVLAVVGAFYAVGLAYMVWLVRPMQEMRLLDAEHME